MGTSFMSDLVIPDPVIEEFGELVVTYLRPSHTDEDLKRRFHIVWFLATEALSQVPNLRGLVVARDVFEEKIQRLGEGAFCVLLRDAAKSKDWHSFLCNGIIAQFYHPNKLICRRVQTYFIFQVTQVRVVQLLRECPTCAPTFRPKVRTCS
jgi:hypothetical protein